MLILSEDKLNELKKFKNNGYFVKVQVSNKLSTLKSQQDEPLVAVEGFADEAKEATDSCQLLGRQVVVTYLSFLP